MVTVGPGRIAGELRLGTVRAVLQQSAQLIDAESIDLSGVTRADSGGVALLLELRRRRGRPLKLEQIPPQLAGLIAFFGLMPILTGASPETAA